MAKRRAAACLLLTGGLCMALALAALLGGKRYQYTYAAQARNAGVGFAPTADYPDAAEEESLVYLEVRWADWEPEEGVYDFAALEERYDLARWRAAGKHAVLRFVCDVPGSEAHCDLPGWLREKTAGATYSTAYGQGYAPDYTDPTLIAAHRKAIEALGGYFDKDNFLLYVELGSLGHWGEWHVYPNAGLPGIPAGEVCAAYVAPYLESFSTAKLLMRRPFSYVAENGLGVYNDMFGAAEDTDEWLGWLENGGSYDQPPTPEPMAAQPAIWNRAPVGGEFTSSIPFEELLGGSLRETLRQLAACHLSFLGPKCPHAETYADQAAADRIRQGLGYQYWVATARRQGDRLTMTWKNSGAAPFYWDWPVCLYEYDADGALLAKTAVELSLSALLPGGSTKTTTVLSGGKATQTAKLAVCDPLTGAPALRLSMAATGDENTTLLFGADHA